MMQLAFRKRKQPEPDDAHKPLTLAEIQAAHQLKLFVTTCQWCAQPTLYMCKAEPTTCGRLTCGRAMKAEWAR